MGGTAHCHQVFTCAVRRFCDMASLSRHSAKLSASLPCEWALAFIKGLRETMLTETFLLLQCFGAVGWAAGRASGL